jgi:hypothetical protein
MRTLSEKLAAYYRNARWRAQRRKSAWNILLIALSLAAWVAIWHALFWLVWAFHVAIYPQHQLADFWPRGISTRSFALSFLMVFALAPAALTLGFMLGNALLWLLPPPPNTRRRIPRLSGHKLYRVDARSRKDLPMGPADRFRGIADCCVFSRLAAVMARRCLLQCAKSRVAQSGPAEVVC